MSLVVLAVAASIVAVFVGPRQLPGSQAQVISPLLGSPKRMSAANQAVAEGVDPHPLDADDFLGRGVLVGHVEGGRGDYLPDLSHRAFRGVELVARSGRSVVNAHASSTARAIYGPRGLAPGVEKVQFYNTYHWMRGAVLRGRSNRPPVTDGVDLFTHSWIGPVSPSTFGLLRRVDYLVDVHDTIMVVGVNNGADSQVPGLLASAYNVIAVGKANGASSGGYTRCEVKGRCKPDLVAAQSTTSAATPVVAAAAARLVEAARAGVGGDDSASRSEVIKAVLMAAAAKTDSWQAQAGRPLDEHLGAGVVRFEEGFEILKAGRPTDGGRVQPRGWDFRSLGKNATQRYTIDVAQGAGEASVMLVWNRRIDGRRVEDLFSGALKWADAPLLANLNLRIARQNPQRTPRTIVAESVSAVDNVEHVYLRSLPPGRYQIEIERVDVIDSDWQYALAWRFEPPADAGASQPASTQAP